MIAAEKWYEYQKCYNKYGIDMKPQCNIKKEDHCRTATPAINFKDKIRLIFLVFLTGCICIGLIVSAAYSAQVKFNTNRIIAQAASVQGEIENLNVAIKSSNNIAVVEERAIVELGMVYPDWGQIIYIKSDCNEIPDFAMTLKQLAFNM
jgi:cell division protein FtsL